MVLGAVLEFYPQQHFLRRRAKHLVKIKNFSNGLIRLVQMIISASLVFTTLIVGITTWRYSVGRIGGKAMVALPLFISLLLGCFFVNFFEAGRRLNFCAI
jgi:Na+/H+-dicarboxylate symporter